MFFTSAEILASEHEEAIFASTEALKNLIHACVDEDLINQGVMMDENVSTRSSGPTIIEKVCATIGSLVDYRYIVVWDMAFQIVSAMFGKLGILMQHSTCFCHYCNSVLHLTLKDE